MPANEMIVLDGLTASALVREIERRTAEGGLVALKVLKSIAENPLAAAQARVAAARGLAEIARLIGARQSAEAEKDPESMSPHELIARLNTLEAELGKRAKVIRPIAPPIDVQLSDMID